LEGTKMTEMNVQVKMEATSELLSEVRGQVGFITLNRPRALNALSLGMVRDLMGVLLAWKDDATVLAVAIRGSNKEGPFGAFCAGGDIRFLHQAGSQGNPLLEDFFTEEYALNHLIHNYGKPYIAFMDGIVMGGGMGISQGAALRVVTERTKMAMPETAIGLFPDVGGGYFLSRCPGRVGEWLALTGDTIGAGDAVEFGLADGCLPVDQQLPVWEALGSGHFADGAAIKNYVASKLIAVSAKLSSARGTIDHYFALPTVREIVRLGPQHGGHAAQAFAADAARGAGAGAPRPQHGPGRRFAHGARHGAPLLFSARRSERNGGGHPGTGRGQGPHAKVEPRAHRRRDAGDGRPVLRQPLACPRASTGRVALNGMGRPAGAWCQSCWYTAVTSACRAGRESCPLNA
jgi:enoyl-CoA hydratase/carnithine racemase